jgi:hypothetical protein
VQCTALCSTRKIAKTGRRQIMFQKGELPFGRTTRLPPASTSPPPSVLGDRAGMSPSSLTPARLRNANVTDGLSATERSCQRGPALARAACNCNSSPLSSPERDEVARLRAVVRDLRPQERRLRRGRAPLPRSGRRRSCSRKIEAVNEGFRCSPLPALCPARLPARRLPSQTRLPCRSGQLLRCRPERRRRPPAEARHPRLA